MPSWSSATTDQGRVTPSSDLLVLVPETPPSSPPSSVKPPSPPSSQSSPSVAAQSPVPSRLYPPALTSPSATSPSVPPSSPHSSYSDAFTMDGNMESDEDDWKQNGASDEEDDNDEEDKGLIDVASCRFDELIIMDHQLPVGPLERQLRERYVEVYHRMLQTHQMTGLWECLVTLDRMDLWWAAVRPHLNPKLVPLLVAAEPPTAYELAEIGWKEGLGVYIKLGLDIEGTHPSMVYVGSATSFGGGGKGSYGLTRRRKDHERALAGKGDQPLHFDRIVRAKPEEWNSAFSTAFLITMSDETRENASAGLMIDIRLKSHFTEALLSEWLECWHESCATEILRPFWPSDNQRSYFGTSFFSPLNQDLILPTVSRQVNREARREREKVKARIRRENVRRNDPEKAAEWRESAKRVREAYTNEAKARYAASNKTGYDNRDEKTKAKYKKQKAEGRAKRRDYTNELKRIKWAGEMTQKVWDDLRIKHGLPPRKMTGS